MRSFLLSFVFVALCSACRGAQDYGLELSPRERALMGQWDKAAEAFEKGHRGMNVRGGLTSAEVRDQLSQEQQRLRSEAQKVVPRRVPPEVAEFNMARAKAESGDSQAQLLVAWMYDNGVGVESDPVEAFHWWRKAGEKGAVVAQYNVAVMYAAGQGVRRNYPEAVEWYRKAAAQGWPDAYANLGWLYNAGRGVPMNKAEARRLWNKGAELGSFKAKVGLSSAQEKVVVGQGPGSVFYLLDDGVCCGEEISNAQQHQAYLAQLRQEEDDRKRREEQKRRFAQRLAQREVAAASLLARNLAAERRSAARTTVYTTPSEGHWIDDVFGNGELVKLEDGSIWRISPLDTATSGSWSAASEITVDEGDELLYPYILVNSDDNELVNARLLKR